MSIETVTFEALIEHLGEEWVSGDDDEWINSDVAALFYNDVDHGTWKLMNDQNILIVNEHQETVTFDTMKLDIVETLGDIVYKCYMDKFDGLINNVLWSVVFRLGGDDDVDYHGGHVGGCAATLRAWCEANDIKHT